MARPPRPPEEVNEYKEKILEEALAMITKYGFDYFSMRKLAAKLNITATTIYNYYSNKDEIYLYILIKGFDHLYQVLLDAYESSSDINNKIRAWIKAYINFGIQNTNYYDLMYTLNVPKYNDYIGCKEETVARAELDAALHNASLWEIIYTELSINYPFFKADDKWFHFTRLWAGSHGIISLYNSRVLNYVIEPTPEVIDRYADQLINMLFMPIAKQ